MSKYKIKKPEFTATELNSNIVYGMTSVNNINQDELDSIQWLCEKSMNDDIKITYLQSQLAEKDKEIESLKHFKVTIGTMENNQVDISSTTYIDQDKISFAVEQLEKVKEEMIYNGNGYCEVRQCSSPHTPNLNYAWFNYIVFNKFIDNQIKQLKENNV